MSFTGQIEPTRLLATLDKAVAGLKDKVSECKKREEQDIADYLAKHPYRHFLWIIWWKRDRISARDKLYAKYYWEAYHNRRYADRELERVQGILATLKNGNIINVTLSEDDLVLLKPYIE